MNLKVTLFELHLYLFFIIMIIEHNEGYTSDDEYEDYWWQVDN